jgi:ADP-ribose pyrophosphatase
LKRTGIFSIAENGANIAGMKPQDLLDIEVLKSADLTAQAERPFVRVWRYLLRHRYANQSVSREYSFDLAVTRFCDAVAVVFYYRGADGKIMVGMRYGTRPALFLRRQHIKSTGEHAEAGVSLELVAGGVEKEDYEGIGIAGRAAVELWEESGFRVSGDQLVSLGAPAYTATGFSIEKTHYFCVEVDPTKRKETGREDNPHEEVGAIEFIELNEALARCREGRIADQKSEIGLFRFASKAALIPKFGLSGGSV